MARGNPYEQGLDKNAANYTPLTPVSLLARTAYVYPQRVAVIHGDRAPHLARGLRALPPARVGAARRGIGAGDTVAAMLPNIPAMYRAHFGVADVRRRC